MLPKPCCKTIIPNKRDHEKTLKKSCSFLSHSHMIGGTAKGWSSKRARESGGIRKFPKPTTEFHRKRNPWKLLWRATRFQRTRAPGSWPSIQKPPPTPTKSSPLSKAGSEGGTHDDDEPHPSSNRGSHHLCQSGLSCPIHSPIRSTGIGPGKARPVLGML